MPKTYTEDEGRLPLGLTNAYALDVLRPEYLELWRTMTYQAGKEPAARARANVLLRDWDVYAAAERATGVPMVVLMCISERESGGRTDCYLGNGQRLDRVTTVVPKNRGPFQDFVAGCVDAMTLEGLVNLPRSYWDVAAVAWGQEKTNGFGYRMRGLRSPYLWGWTNHQQSGKYPADGVFDPNAWDTQPGGMAVYGELVKIHPELALDRQPPIIVVAPGERPEPPVAPLPPVKPKWWERIIGFLADLTRP